MIIYTDKLGNQYNFTKVNDKLRFLKRTISKIDEKEYYISSQIITCLENEINDLRNQISELKLTLRQIDKLCNSGKKESSIKLLISELRNERLL